jgi:DNA-binding CsgD family transcriptional regulator
MDERVLAVLPDLYALVPAEQFPARALAIVRGVVGGDKGDYTEVDLRSGQFRVLVDPEPAGLSDLREARRAHMREHPVLAHFLSSAAPDARLISDFLTRREFHRLALHGDFFAYVGVEDQLSVVVSRPSSGCVIGVSIDRDRRSFENPERRLMERLRPHLAAARDNAVRFSEALARGTWESQGAVCALGRLTDRQRDILAHVAAGRTNAQVALALDISVGTVRKHLEHILRRLEVTTRTAAAACFITGSRVGERRWWTASEVSMLNGPTKAGGALPDPVWRSPC